MATTLSIGLARRNAMLDALTASAANGKLRVYSGSVPANADASIGAAVQLAELTMGATAFGAASGGVLTANAITQDSSADASGTASFWRLWDSAGTTCLAQGTVGTSGESMTVPTTTVTVAVAYSCSSLTITFPA